jgi:hypothetical protein
VPETEQLKQEKATVFRQLLRLKQIELTLKPAPGYDGDSFPLDLGLSNFQEHQALLSRLPDLKKMAKRIAKGVSLSEILSGRMTAEDLAKNVEKAWKDCHIEATVREFAESDEITPLLQELASRISPLFPLASDSPAGLLLCPPGAACSVNIKGFEPAASHPEEYVLVVADDCADIGVLDTEEGAVDG